MEQGNSGEREVRLDELFRAYRAASDGPAEASANFMPAIWAGIEARQVSTNWFGSVARVLVTAGLAATVIIGLMISSRNQSSAFFDATFEDALQADHVSTLEPLHIERISYIEPQ